MWENVIKCHEAMDLGGFPMVANPVFSVLFQHGQHISITHYDPLLLGISVRLLVRNLDNLIFPNAQNHRFQIP